MEISIPQKQCKRCERTLPIAEFSRDKQKSDGYYSYCKDCVRIYQKHRLETNADHVRTLDKTSRDKRKDRVNAERRERYAANPEPFRQRAIDARNRNVEVIRQKDRIRSAKEKDKRSASRKVYYLKNKYIFRAATTRRLARERGLPDEFSSTDWLRALEYFNGVCAVCGRPPGLWHKLAADHWIPINNPECPGTVPTNIVPLCHGEQGCNCSKRDSDPEYWLRWKFGDRKAKRVLKRVEEYFSWLASFQ